MPIAGRSHRRLFFAMGASSALLTAMLWLLSEFLLIFDCDRWWCTDQNDVLTIQLQIQKDEAVPADTEPERPAPDAPQVKELMDSQPPVGDEKYELPSRRDESEEPPIVSAPKRDWHAMAKESAIRSTDEVLQNEESREKMWRQTRSVMFADTGVFDVHEPAPVMPDIEFRVPVGVLGLGITIGGCFIGIPLAGIPVEERTARPNVIYCKDLYE